MRGQIFQADFHNYTGMIWNEQIWHSYVGVEKHDSMVSAMPPL